MIDEHWLQQAVAAERHTEHPDSVERLRHLLSACAVGFAQSRSDVGSPSITWPKRGIHPDEAATFLRGVDLGHVTVDRAGYVRLPRVRSKAPAGRYALLSKNGAGVSVNLEYLIQIGATTELIEDLGWPPDELDFERGEFDALGHGPDGRVILAVEAKARVTGSDSLEKMVLRWLSLASASEGAPMDNAGRKYRELTRLCEAGPVTVWLVAAGARWSMLATTTGGSVNLEPSPQPSYTSVNVTETGPRVLWVRPYSADLHARGTQAAGGRCSWFCLLAARFSVRVREIGGTESTFGLCEAHRARVEKVYAARTLPNSATAPS